MKFVLPAVGITLLLAFLSSSLIGIWLNSPYDKMGGIAFVVWLAGPVLGRQLRWPTLPWVHTIAALVASLGWLMGDFRFIIYFAFALALFGFLEVRPRSLIWLLSALCWMPLFGYTLSHLQVGTLWTHVIRLVVAILAFYIILPLKAMRTISENETSAT